MEQNRHVDYSLALHSSKFSALLICSWACSLKLGVLLLYLSTSYKNALREAVTPLSKIAPEYTQMHKMHCRETANKARVLR